MNFFYILIHFLSLQNLGNPQQLPSKPRAGSQHILAALPR